MSEKILKSVPVYEMGEKFKLLEPVRRTGRQRPFAADRPSFYIRHPDIGFIQFTTSIEERSEQPINVIAPLDVNPKAYYVISSADFNDQERAAKILEYPIEYFWSQRMPLLEISLTNYELHKLRPDLCPQGDLFDPELTQEAVSLLAGLRGLLTLELPDNDRGANRELPGRGLIADRSYIDGDYGYFNLDHFYPFEFGALSHSRDVRNDLVDALMAKHPNPMDAGEMPGLDFESGLKLKVPNIPAYADALYYSVSQSSESLQ